MLKIGLAIIMASVIGFGIGVAVMARLHARTLKYWQITAEGTAKRLLDHRWITDYIKKN